MTTAQSDPKPLSISTTGGDDDQPGPWFDLELDGVKITARRPKLAMWMLAVSVWGDKYADDSETARAVFDFLAASLNREAWQHVRARLRDGEDGFGTTALAQLFEGLVDEIRRLEPALAEDSDEQRPVNRAARRAGPRRG